MDSRIDYIDFVLDANWFFQRIAIHLDMYFQCSLFIQRLETIFSFITYNGSIFIHVFKNVRFMIQKVFNALEYFLNLSK